MTDVHACKKLAIGQMVVVRKFPPGWFNSWGQLSTGMIIGKNPSFNRRMDDQIPAPGYVRVQFTKLCAVKEEDKQFHNDFRATHLEALVGEHLAWATEEFEKGK
jgi:hypothetical protein